MDSGSLQTRLIHAGRRFIEGAVTTPIFQSATYQMGQQSRYADVKYVRLNNSPNHDLLADRLASVCEGEAALVTASGMSAIATAVFSTLQAGDHLLAQSTLYGGTATLLGHEAARMGISITMIDAQHPEQWRAALQDNTRMFYVESISNPLMSIGDLPAVIRFSREHSLRSVIDNTFGSPVNFRPLSMGFDMVVHSATKYLNGHSDIAAGVIAGDAEGLAAARAHLNHFGASLDPHSCFLLERGLKTLALRVRQQNENAMALAEMLVAHPSVARVFYPGLSDSMGHKIAQAHFDGFGGMLAFEMVEAGAAERWVRAVELAVHAPSLGGLETLVVRPAKSSHLGMTPEERAAAGISDELIRISVGVEGIEDLKADFQRAFDANEKS